MSATDITTELQSNTAIALRGAVVATLPPGRTTYTGALTGSGTIALSSAATGGSTLVIGAQTFTLPVANQVQTLSYANGGWSADVTAAILANQDIVVSANTVVKLPVGATTYTGTITGAGNLTFVASATGPSSLVLTKARETITLSAANQSMPATLAASGNITVDLSSAIRNNQDIVLNGDATLTIANNWATYYTGRITGSGTIRLANTDGSNATLDLAGSNYFNLARGGSGTSQLITLKDGAWTSDFTAALLANNNIGLTVPTTITLPPGTTTYSGNLFVNSGIQNGQPGIPVRTTTLTLTAGAGGSTLVMNGRTIVLPDGGLTETFTLTDGGSWTADLSAAIQAGHDINLSGIPSVIRLPAGTADYAGRITGPGTITIGSAPGAGSTLLIGGQTLALPSAGQVQTLSVSATGALSVDVTASLLANQDITLTGLTTTASLPAGASTYAGTLSGNGTITLRSANVAGGSSVVIGGQSFVLGAANAAVLLTRANGAWTADVTSQVLARQAVTLTVPSTLIVPAGNVYGGAISGASPLTISTGAGGGATITLGNVATFALPDANQTVTATFANGAWTVDASASFLAGQDIALLPASLTAVALPAGTNTYPGAITGNGRLQITSGAAGGSTLVLADGTRLVMPDAGTSATLVRAGNGAWSVDVTAAIAADKDIVLNGTPAFATLQPGVNQFTGDLTGTGILTLTSSSAGGGTLVLKDGTTFRLPDAGETQVATFADGKWSVDVTQAMRNNQDVVLSKDYPTVVVLPRGGHGGPGVIDFKGDISGDGQLVVFAQHSNLILPDGTTVNLGWGNQAPLQRVVLNRVGGVWNTDYTGELLANNRIVLSGPTTLTLPSGDTRHTGGISGNGTITLKSGATGGSRLNLDGAVFVIPSPNQTMQATLGSNGWVVDYTGSLNADANIYLTTNATLKLGAGTTDYSGQMFGSGAITVTSSATGPSTLILRGTVAGSTVNPLTLVLTGPNQTQIATLDDGRWTVDISASVLANQDIVLTGNSIVRLPAGLTTYTGKMTGSGSVVIAGNSAGPVKLDLAQARQTITQTAANQTIPATVTPEGVWSINLDRTVIDNRDIVLDGNATLVVGDNGTTNYTGKITGNGSITLIDYGGFNSTFLIANTAYFNLARGVPTTQTIILKNGVWSADVTAAILANTNVGITVPTTIRLPPGTTTFGGNLFVNNAIQNNAPGTPVTRTTLTFVAGEGGSTFVMNGRTIVLPDSGQSQTFTITDGGSWSTDLTGNLLANADITLTGLSTTIALPGGTTRYAGTLDGRGALTLTSGTSPATLVLKDGTTFALAGGTSATATLSAAGWRIDATPALLANKPISLTLPTTLALPAGTTQYTGAITGTAPLTLTSANVAGGSTLVVGGKTFTLPAGNQSVTATLSNGVWTTDVSASLAANQNVVLGGGPNVATLPPGSSTYYGTIGGTGTLVLTASATGPSLVWLRNNGVTFVLPEGGETQTATLAANGTWSVDVSAALRAGHDITLTTNATAILPAGTTAYAGALTGTGVLTLTAAGYPATFRIPGLASFALSAANPSATVTYANGAASVEIGTALAAGQTIVLAGASTATLPAGTTTYTGALSGSGTIRLTSGTGAATLVVGSQSFVLPAGGITQTLTFSGGAWTADIGAAIRANQPIVLTGAATLALGGGTTNYQGALTGTGTITITSPANSGSALLVNGATVSLPSGGQTLVLSIANGAVSSVDVTAALLANQTIALTVPATARLPAGETRYTGTLTGSAPLTLTSGSTGGSTVMLANGTTFVLPEANETATFAFVNNAWTVNATRAFLAGQDIVLNQPTTITLPAGTTTYQGALTGTAPLVLVSGSTPATVRIGSQTFTLASANQTQTLTVAGGIWTADIGAAIRANQAITLTGPTIVALGSGTTTYTGALSGSGTITLTSPANSGSSLVLSSGQTLVLPSGGSTQVANVANGFVTSVDVTAALVANRNLTLGVPLTVALPAGTTTYTGALNGNGTLRITSAAGGASTLVIGGQSFVLPVSGETQTLTRTNGLWSMDVTAAIRANQDIVLTGNATIVLPAGTTTYTGRISGQGSLTATAPAGGASVLTLGGATTYTVPAGQSVRQTLLGGQWSQDVTAQILANQDIVLNGPAAVYLTGNANYTGTITGTGALVVTAPANAGATLSLKGANLVSIPTPGQTTTVALAGGVWTQDLTAHILASQNVSLVVPATVTLPAGVTRYNGTINNNGAITLKSGPAGGATLALSGGRTFILSGPNQSLTVTQQSGQWTSTVSALIAANQPITLTGAATAALPAGTTTYTGTIAGTGRLTLTAPAAGASTLILNGTAVTVGAGLGTTVTVVNGAIATDVAAAIAANQAIVLSGAMAAVLPAGTTTYTGTVSGAGTLALISANASAGSAIVIGGQTFTLPAANETLVLTRAGGTWTTDISLAVANNQAVVLNGAATLQLLPGLQTDRAAISGTGTITLRAADVPGGSTFAVGGRTYVLAAPGATQILTLSGGAWSTDLTAMILADRPIALFGANTATLPAGTTGYDGALTGSGTLRITSSASGPSTLVIGSTRFTLASANQSQTLTLSANGTWSADIGSPLAASQDIVLSEVPATATLPAGTTTYTGTISGAGTLALTSGGAGPATLFIGGQSFVLASANQTQTLTRSASGAWSVDVTQAMLANQNVTLTGQATVLALPSNGLTYRGTLGGDGTITVSSGPAGGASFNFGGPKGVYLPGANLTNVLTVKGGVVTSVDVTRMLLANQNVYVSVNATATLPAGTTTYAGNLGIDSGATLTLTSSGGGATLVLPNGTTFVLPEAGETIAFTYANGVGWTATATAAALAGHDIVLNQPTTITLPAGTLQVGTITGTAPLTLVSGPGGSTLRLADGTVFTLPGTNQTQVVSLANGAWTTDLSASLRANLPIVLNGANVATLAAGTTLVTQPISGSGTLRIVSANVAGGSTLVLNGKTITLPSGNTTNVLTLAGGVWSVDVTSAINNRQAIVLDGAQTVQLNPGGTFTAASITGTGSLVVTASATGPSVLQLGSATLSLPEAGTTVTLSPVAGGGWSADITAAFLAGNDLTLSTSLPSTLALPSGTTTYAGTLNGNGTLTVTTPASGGATLVIGSQTFLLPGAGVTQTLSLANGAWTTDVSAAILANKTLALNGTATIATLPAGTTTYTGTITGTGSIRLTSSTAGASTLVLADGTRFVLPAGASTATATLSGGRWSLDVSALVLANKPISLTGTTVMTLPGGTTTYTGAVTGSGSVTFTSASNAASTFVIGGQSIGLPAWGTTQTLTFANGVVTGIDVTAAVLAGKSVVLGGPMILTLPAGDTVATGAITGTGALTIRSGAAGGTLTLPGGARFVLPDAGETIAVSLSGGKWTADVSAAIADRHSVTVTGETLATLGGGTIEIGALKGSGTLTLTSSASGGATLVTADGKRFSVPGGGQSLVVRMNNDVASIDLTSLLTGNRAIVLGSDATAFLPDGQSSFTGTITGTGKLTLFGSRTGSSTITIGGTAYTIAANAALSLTQTNGVFTTPDKTDISAAIAADQQTIVFTGGKYVVSIPPGQVYTYTGKMIGYGTLQVTGGGRLVLLNDSTFTLPPDQQQEYVTVETNLPTVYDGINFGQDYVGSGILHGKNPPVVTIDKGTTLDFGDATGAIKAYGNVSNVKSAGFGFYNTNNIEVNGTLNVTYNPAAGGGYALVLGKLSGNGVVSNHLGSVFAGGDSDFTGILDVSGFNIGWSRWYGSISQASVVSNNFVLYYSTPLPTAEGFSGILDVPSTIYRFNSGNSIHNIGPGLVIFSGRYSWSNSGSSLAPSLSDERLNFMQINRGANNSIFYLGKLQQFGDGTNADFFIRGNASNSVIRTEGPGTLGFNYNGRVVVDVPIRNNSTDLMNLVIVGTPGNHIVLTQAEHYNGFTKIDRNAILQLGDGTGGNSEVITVDGITGTYSTSGGNGSIRIAESADGQATNAIINDGQLIVDNVDGALNGIEPISLSHISGIGSFTQQGTQTVTFLADTTYTGKTDIANGTLALADSSGWTSIASSSSVNLLNAAAVFDISQTNDQEIQNLSGAAGSTVALGGRMLTVASSADTSFAGRFVDGGIGGGAGGGLTKVDGGKLELSGASTYTGQTNVEAGTLQLNGATLSTNQIKVAAGSLLSGSGTVTGAVIAAGTIVAAGGTLTLGQVTGTGKLAIADGATLVLAGATGQDITFQGAGTLTLGNAATYTGTIHGFGAETRIDLAGLVSTSVAYVAQTGMLRVLNGATEVARLHIGPVPAGEVFGVTSDGRGGSLITGTVPAAAATSGLVLTLSEDAWNGHAQFSVSVNGVQQAGVYTVTAQRSLGETQDFVIPGSFGTGVINVGITFLNDAYAGTPSTDRNLYLEKITNYGVVQTVNTRVNGGRPASFMADGSTTYTIGALDKVTLKMSEDAYQGDAQFTVSIDGVQQGGVRTMTALRSLGQTQDVDILGDFGVGPHTVSVNFLNDKWGGSTTTDRNLYVDAITYNGQTTVVNAAQLAGGSRSYSGLGLGVRNIASPDATLVSTGGDTINAGAGNATITLNGPGATVNGGTGTTTVVSNGNDTIIANAATMSVTGGAGALTFLGGSALATIVGGSGSASITAGSGGLAFLAGTGTASITAGSGADLLTFVNGSAGGTTVIDAFTQGADRIALKGYDAAAVTQAIDQATVSGGSSTIVLPDQTKIVMSGITAPNHGSFTIG